MSDKAVAILAGLLVFGLIVGGFIIGAVARGDCESKGGVLLQGQCVKVERIL